jgi:hypothetical protein
MEQTIQPGLSLLEMMIGPMGGLITVFVVLYGTWILLKRYIIPLVENAVGKHLEQVEKLIISHDADRKVFEKGMKSMSGRLDRIQEDIVSIKGCIKGAKNES